MRMGRPRLGQGQGRYCLVLNRSCSDLYDKIADLFADRRYVKVVVDRRRGKEGMAEIPPSEGRCASKDEMRQREARMVSSKLRREAE